VVIHRTGRRQIHFKGFANFAHFSGVRLPPKEVWLVLRKFHDFVIALFGRFTNILSA
jgi:hypothetical protein